MNIRALLRSFSLNLLSIGVTPSKGIHLMNSHLLSMDDKLDTNHFDDLLKKISKRATIIPFDEAVDFISCKKHVDHALVAFSFDDGIAECYTHIMPVLEKYNGYACFFINPNFINGDENYISSFLNEKVHLPLSKHPMSWEQVIDLHKRGHIIGAHTMDHIRISEIVDKDELHYQIGQCKKEIESFTKINSEYFAFPYGVCEKDFNLESIFVAEQYYKYVFSASNWRSYFSYEGKVLNRRHFEPYWNANHINYFLSKKINY